MAGITPLNNFLGPESDPVTADMQLPKYQSTKGPAVINTSRAREQLFKSFHGARPVIVTVTVTVIMIGTAAGK